MLSIIVPAYNEEQRLPATLERMREYLDGRDEPYEVLVVDDGSTDSTLSLARSVAAGWPQLQVLALPANEGKGAAVRLGMLSARGEHRVFSDADLSTPIEEIERLRARLQGRCAVAIASRALPEFDDRRAPTRTPRGDGPHLQPSAPCRRVARAA